MNGKKPRLFIKKGTRFAVFKTTSIYRFTAEGGLQGLENLMTFLKNWGNLLLLIGLFFLLTGLFSCTQTFSRRNHPSAFRGVLDLRDWDPDLQGPVNLDGQWEFYWDKLIEPEEFSKVDLSGAKEYLMVPGIWNGQVVRGRKLPGQGYGTYHLKVLLKPGREIMSFKLMSLGTAYSLYVNGRLVASAGQVGKTRETMKPEWKPQVASFLPQGDRLDLVLQVSNFHHRKGGATESIWLGTEKDIWQMRVKNLAFQLFLCGSIFIMGLYHLGLFLLRKKEKASLYFGLFSLLIALYTLLAGERYFLHIFPTAGWELRVRLTNLSSFLSVPVFLLFVGSLFPEDSMKRITGFFLASVGVLSLIVLITPAVVYSRVIPVFHLLTLAAAIYTLIIFSLALRRKRAGAVLLLSGVLIIIITVVNDILYDNGIVNTGQSIYLGFFLFIFIQSFLLSHRFSKTFTIIEDQGQVLIEANKVIQREMNERLQVEKALLDSEKKYRELMEGAPVGLCITDLEGKVLYVNRQFEQLSGYPGEEILRKNGLDLGLFSVETRAILAERMRKRLAGGSQAPAEIELVRKDGGKRWVELTGRIVHDQGIPSGFQIAVSDITPRKLAQEELQKAHDQLEKRVQERTADLNRINDDLRKEIIERKRTARELSSAKETAEAANRAKSEFLANMSHELRTPLNHIIGFNELVLSESYGELNPLQEEFLNDVLHSSRQLLSLINDILDLSKVEAGKMEMNFFPVYLRPFLEKSLNMVKEKAHKHHIDLQTEYKDLPESIQADERKLKQILYNLLSNAVKFTPDGGTIRLTALLVNGDFIRISILDTGIGLTETDLERIFKPFEQADSSSGRKYQGTGLGLALARQLVELHGGRIWAESQGLGQGAGFYFILPVRNALCAPGMEVDSSEGIQENW
jgi:PAS domain S-box-containing protein